ncbi:MAG TPA: hemolysin family protein [Gemmatimonadales bacterium]|nr:hemolysin family protein [Gemmatimonadales bacterium]
MPVTLGLVLVVALVAANAFFVAAEFALVGARKTRLDEMARAGDRQAALARRAITHLDRYISATQLGITLASLGLGWIGEPAVASVVEDAFTWLPAGFKGIATHSVAVVIAFAFITVLHIVLGELAPKAIALLFPERVSRWVAAPLMGFSFVMAWPIRALNGTANQILRLFRIKPAGEHERVHSPEEIRMLVEQSQEFGTLGREDARLLAGVFEFSEKTAEEVMTPRTAVVAVAADSTVEAAADVVAEAQRSRYPVYEETLDEVVGVVLAKDILRAVRQAPGSSVRSIMRAPLFAPGTREVEDVLADMKRLKLHMAIVLDEYGGTAGLVTMEDLLEEIVGAIEDEYDVAKKLAAKDGARLLDGAMTIGDFNSAYDADLSSEDYTTLGGYLFGQLGRLPAVGDRVATAKHTFEIAEMEGRRVRAVRLVRKDGTPAAGG